MTNQEIQRYCPRDVITGLTEGDMKILVSEATGRKKATQALLMIDPTLEIHYTKALYDKDDPDPNSSFDIYFVSAGTTTICVEAKDRRKYDYDHCFKEGNKGWMLDGYKWMSLHNLGSVTKQGRPVEKWYISTHQSGFRVWDIENFSSTDERLCPR